MASREDMIGLWERDLLAANRAATVVRNRYMNATGGYADAWEDGEYRFWASECVRLSALIAGIVTAGAELDRLAARQPRPRQAGPLSTAREERP